MLPEIHAALQRLIWEYGRISPDEVDISFEPPTRDRIERLVRPTVSLFLFDLVENTDMRQSSFPVTRASDHAERKMPPRQVDLRYMVSALTTDIEDEHRLLWRVLATLLKYSRLPDDVLPEELHGGEVPLTTKTIQGDDGRRLLDIWGGLSVPPRPAIYYVVTAPLDLDIVARSPLVLTRTLRYRRTTSDTIAYDATTDIGGVVHDKTGQPVSGATLLIEGSARAPVWTNAAGEFVLSAVEAGDLRVRVTPPDGRARTVTLKVPGASYDVSLD